jgi:hypothetical protein
MNKYDIFKKAIDNKFIVEIVVMTQEKGKIKRTCIPFDFGPSRKFKDKIDRYYFYDLDSPEGKHNLSITPDQLLEIQLTIEKFNPADYVKWKPNWFVKRDWGKYS